MFFWEDIVQASHQYIIYIILYHFFAFSQHLYSYHHILSHHILVFICLEVELGGSDNFEGDLLWGSIVGLVVDDY